MLAHVPGTGSKPDQRQTWIYRTPTGETITTPRPPQGASRCFLRTRLTLWTAAIALLAVAAVVLGGRLMVQASLQDQRQALAEQLRIGFQAQRTLLDRQALWLTSALERAGPVDPAPSSDRWQARLRAVANTLHGDGQAVPEQLTIVDRRGQVVATWRPDGKVGATVPCATVRGLVTRWREVDRRPLVAGICAGDTQAHYVTLVPLRASGATMFLEVSSDLQATLRSLEQSLRIPRATCTRQRTSDLSGRSLVGGRGESFAGRVADRGRYRQQGAAGPDRRATGGRADERADRGAHAGGVAGPVRRDQHRRVAVLVSRSHLCWRRWSH